ncbi:Bug family tripartite tricarboxylate transporter substrate binding protein [Rhodoplanes sp. Z2-YC6860]|uniref:Bug family tripartite tricarboxylate transporter substrate binding protein n=1 Tax=Rhodoplanes sp. Z2-YC6860 TaxID=674703 RepID=UPI00078E32E1|nr:tripartite tricarboxylate transporter substrate binding protein [Rhodoplanes sp. Z2-YC6860]AMN44488.1 extra-cytoplasmic solute receptor [Rhodoplanes sp. Z2-YC6860]
MSRLGLMLGALLSVCAGPIGVQAETYPSRTIRVVVPYAPGGGVSILGQIVTNKMSEILKQPIIIDNRPGAGGNLGAEIVAKSPPDGYTILLHTSAMSSASALYSKLPFDPSKDFIPVTMVISTQFVIAGSPKDPATNLTELATEAKATPGALNFGSSGPGSSLHIFAEMFNSFTGIRMVHIPYRGDAPMVTALIGNDIQLAFLPQANGIANVQSNLIRGLGVTGTKRMEALPNVATAAEQGVKGLEVGSWNAMFVPAGTPPEIVKTIQQAVAQALADPKLRETLIQTGQEPVGDTPEQFAATFKADVARFSKVVEVAKIPKLD